MHHVETMQHLNCPELSTTAHELVQQCTCSTTLQRISSVNLHDQIREKAEDGCYDLRPRSLHKLTDRLLGFGADAKAVASNGWTALHIAAENGHLEVTNCLLEAGADEKAVASNGWTALHIAAQNGHLKVANRLLQAGADAKAVASNGVTALYLAAGNGHLKVTNRLLEAGADAKAVKNNGWTALHITALLGHLEVMNYLFGLGLRPNELSYASMSPFHLAAQSGRVEMMVACLRASGDPWLLDGFGLNVLDWASNYAPARRAMGTLYSDYQPTESSISSQCLAETIRKLLRPKCEDVSYYELGFLLLHGGHESDALVAFEHEISPTQQDTGIVHEALCNRCIDGNIRGLRYVCRTCANVDLCEQCFDKYNEGEWIRACQGHDFLSVPSPCWKVLEAPHINKAGETLEQWLSRLKIQWNGEGQD